MSLHNIHHSLFTNQIKSSLDESIESGLKFLHKNQMLHGEFKTYASFDPAMQKDRHYVSTTYITTFVLYSLGFIVHPLVDIMKQSALGFLREEMEFPGVWRFFSVDRNMKISGGKFVKYSEVGIIPDLDDTACASYCLKKNGIPFGSNTHVFMANRDCRGLFFTWLMDYPKRAEHTETTPYMVPEKNDICVGVNANILLYLGEDKYTSNSCTHINSIISNGKEAENIPYFPGRLSLYYLVSRAYYNGSTSLGQSCENIMGKINMHSCKDGSYGSILSTAYVVCTLLNFNHHDERIHMSAKYIIDSQDDDGSWKMERFCDGSPRYYGSRELTTSICLEALARYERRYSE